MGVLASGTGIGAVDLEVVTLAAMPEIAAMPEPAPAKWPAALTPIPGETKRRGWTKLLAGWRLRGPWQGADTAGGVAVG